jgi:hypothetical protein
VALTKIRDTAAIVCLGAFNPAIFHPSWLAARKLIQKTEEAGAEVQVVSPDVSQFKMKWLQLQVLRERFTATVDTLDDSLLLRDLVVGAFRFLEHTPVTAVGLNRQIQFQVKDLGEWHHVGHVLAPKKIWRRYLKEPGLGLLSIKGRRPDKLKGEINVQVNPALGHPKPHVVETSVNSHFDVREMGTAGAVAQLISDEWERSMEFAGKLLASVIEDAIKEPEPRD